MKVISVFLSVGIFTSIAFANNSMPDECQNAIDRLVTIVAGAQKLSDMKSSVSEDAWKDVTHFRKSAEDICKEEQYKSDHLNP